MTDKPETEAPAPASEKRRCQVYVGKLSRDTTEEVLEKEFAKFGKHDAIVLKRGFAFIVMRSPTTR